MGWEPLNGKTSYLIDCSVADALNGAVHQYITTREPVSLIVHGFYAGYKRLAMAVKLQWEKMLRIRTLRMGLDDSGQGNALGRRYFCGKGGTNR